MVEIMLYTISYHKEYIFFMNVFVVIGIGKYFTSLYHVDTMVDCKISKRYG